MRKKYSRGTQGPAQFTFFFNLRILCFFFFGIFHHLPSPSQDLLLSSAFYITCVFHFQTFFFFRSSFLLQVFLFFFFLSGSSFFIILLLFSLSFFKAASMSLSNSSSMWLNSSMPTIEFVFESLDFCHQTWDASLQHSFKIMLTNENVSRNHVKSQFSPYYTPKN